jgi:hypothetical protein
MLPDTRVQIVVNLECSDVALIGCSFRRKTTDTRKHTGCRIWGVNTANGTKCAGPVEYLWSTRAPPRLYDTMCLCVQSGGRYIYKGIRIV